MIFCRLYLSVISKMSPLFASAHGPHLGPICLRVDCQDSTATCLLKFTFVSQAFIMTSRANLNYIVRFLCLISFSDSSRVCVSWPPPSLPSPCLSTHYLPHDLLCTSHTILSARSEPSRSPCTDLFLEHTSPSGPHG